VVFVGVAYLESFLSLFISMRYLIESF